MSSKKKTAGVKIKSAKSLVFTPLYRTRTVPDLKHKAKSENYNDQ